MLRSQAQAALLGGVAAGQDLYEIERAVGAFHVKGYSPDIAMLEVVAAALDIAGVDPGSPVNSRYWRRDFLPEISDRSKDYGRVQHLFLTAAAMRGGVFPDVLDDTYWWGGKKLWPLATAAAVMTVRALGPTDGLAAFCEQVGSRLPDFHAHLVE